MTGDERHGREMTMNAHFAWGLAMWGSADIAAEQSNLLLACYGYYYSVFHAGVALIATDHSYHLDDMKQMRHSKLESWLQGRLELNSQMDFAMLQGFRESTSYLGMGSPSAKLRVIRGHPFGFDLGSRRLGFAEAVREASDASRRIVLEVLGQLEQFCAHEGWRGPKCGDGDWVTEYLQEDLLLSVIPRGGNGGKMLSRAFSLLDASNGDS